MTMTGSSGTVQVSSFDEGWSRLQEGAFDRVVSLLETGFRTAPKFEPGVWMELYTTVYVMCTQKEANWSEQVYSHYVSSLETYILTHVLPAFEQRSDEDMLVELSTRWDNHKILMRYLKTIFGYLDRYHVKRAGLPSVQNAAVLAFRNLVFEKVKVRARDAVIHMINKMRDGETIDAKLLKELVTIFIEMGQDEESVYERDFEADVLASTSAYFREESSRWIDRHSLPEYISKVEARLESEADYVAGYLHPSTKEKLLKSVEKSLLEEPMHNLLDKEFSGCATLLLDNREDDLSRLYRLFSRLGDKGLEPIGSLVQQHVLGEGNALVRSREEEVQKGSSTSSGYIKSLLEMHRRFKGLLAKCFQNHHIFQRAIKNAFEDFVNRNIGSSNISEMLSSFSDEVLRKNGVKLTDDAREDMLDQIVDLFTFITDKDMFAEFYRKFLCKRLLLSRSLSEDTERSMITKLKQRCGAQFTSKMEGMLTDMNLSEDLHGEFLAWTREHSESLPVDASFTILTSGSWPAFRPDECILPDKLVKCMDVFSRFYANRGSHRTLRWVHKLGLATVVARYSSRSYEITLALHQALILLLFNSEDRITLEDISRKTSIPVSDAKRYVFSLACGPRQLLLRDGDDSGPVKGLRPGDLDPADVFVYNAGFSDRRRKIQMPYLLQKVTEEERHAARAAVDDDRKHAIEAALVRIMKSRKTMEHAQLVSEASQQLVQYFTPQPQLIKKRIEELIQREYLERDEKQRNVYNYVA